MRLEKEISIQDRLALGLLNGVLGLPTGFALWLLLNGFLLLEELWLPLQAVFWFALVMAVLGMFFHDAVLSAFYGRLWAMLVTWSKY